MPPSSFALSFTPTFHRAQALSKLLLSFWWRDSALCHACLELLLCPLFFPLARNSDSNVLVPISHDRKVPTSYSADFAEKISKNDFDNSAKVEIYGDDLRILAAFPRFSLSHYSATFYSPLPFIDTRINSVDSNHGYLLSISDIYRERDLYGEL